MFCGKCGAKNPDTNKFCENCGRAFTRPQFPGAAPAPAAPFPVTTPPQAPPVYSAPPPPPPVYSPVQQSNEPVVGVIWNARIVKMFGFSTITYTIAITPRRMIIAQLTGALLTAAGKEAVETAKAQGKGVFDTWKDQLAAHFQYSQRYFNMTPDQILAETPGNRAIDNAQISAIRMKVEGMVSSNIPEGQFKMIIESSQGKFEYMIPEEERFTSMLKDVYGEKLHMPFGYISSHGVHVKFF